MDSWLLAQIQRVGVLRRLLSEGELKKIRVYEKEHKNRKTLIEHLDRKAQPHRAPHRRGVGCIGLPAAVTTLVRWEARQANEGRRVSGVRAGHGFDGLYGMKPVPKGANPPTGCLRG